MVNSGTDWGLIVSIITLVLVAGGVGWGIYKWYCHRQQFKDPIELSYLIPQNQYPEAKFEGAPNKEIKPHKLTVGIGTYRLIHVITPKTDMLIDALVLRFEGDDTSKPKRCGPDNPFITNRIDRRGETYYLDWWGDVQPNPSNFPRYIHYGDTLVVGNRIKTLGIWQGKAYFEFPIRGERIIVKKLDFQVTDNPKKDEIPFLRVEDK